MFVVTGSTEEDMREAQQATCQQIAFYGSTPAYKPVLDSIGAGELQGELNTMSKQGRWKEMGTLITDEILSEFGVVAEPKDIASEILRKYSGFTDRTSGAFPVEDESQRQAIIRALKEA